LHDPIDNVDVESTFIGFRLVRPQADAVELVDDEPATVRTSTNKRFSEDHADGWVKVFHS